MFRIAELICLFGAYFVLSFIRQLDMNRLNSFLKLLWYIIRLYYLVSCLLKFSVQSLCSPVFIKKMRFIAYLFKMTTIFVLKAIAMSTSVEISDFKWNKYIKGHFPIHKFKSTYLIDLRMIHKITYDWINFSLIIFLNTKDRLCILSKS